MGMTATSEVCSSFEPNLRQVEDVVADEGGFMALARIVDTMGEKSLRAMGAMLMREEHTRKAGYKFGQVVYVRYRGKATSNYISNFMQAYVMFVNNSNYRLMSKDGKCVLTYSSECKPHILTKREFSKLRNSMIDKGRMVDPEVERTLSKRLQAEEDYELGITKESLSGNVTTIDTVFKENKAPRRGNINDLVSIVNDIEAGFTDNKGGYRSGVSNKKSKRISSTAKTKRSKSGNTTIAV